MYSVECSSQTNWLSQSNAIDFCKYTYTQTYRGVEVSLYYGQIDRYLFGKTMSYMYNTYKSDMKQNQKLMWKFNTAYNFKNSWIKLILHKKYCFAIIAHKFISHEIYQFLTR